MLTGYISKLTAAVPYIFHKDYIVYLIFILPSIVSYITLTICYKTSFYYNRFPDWVYSPWISFTGVNKPESNVFAGGLTTAGLCIFVVNHMFTTKLMSHKDNNGVVNTNHLNFYLNHLLCHKYIKYVVNKILDCILSYNLIIAAIALCIQSWINVDNQQVLTFLSPSMQTMSFFPDWAHVIHIGCAAIFFFGCALFHNMSVILTFNYSKNKLLLYSFIYKIIILFICCIAGLTLFWSVYYTSYIVDPHSDGFRFGVNTIGVCQYTAAMCNCLFVGSYALDYYVCHVKVKNNQPEKTKQS